MSTICEEFDLRLKNEEVTGTCNWIRGIDWEERRDFNKHLDSLSSGKHSEKQRLILLFANNIYEVLMINIK